MLLALLVLTGALFALLIVGTMTANAATPQDPKVGGQLNQCWGQISSQLAQLEVDAEDGEVLKGGSHGLHNRSTTAADISGGFAHTGNDAGVLLNVDGGRSGVGNVSLDVHFVAPGDGGNGQHAINNSTDTDSPTGGLSNLVNPYSGDATTAAGGTGDVETLICVLRGASASK